MSGFTHFDEEGNAIMVDVTDKAVTERTAVASGCIRVNEAVYQAITERTEMCLVRRELQGLWLQKEPGS